MEMKSDYLDHFLNDQTLEIWDLKEVDQGQVDNLAKVLDIHPLVAKILLVRNVSDLDVRRLKHFINPSKTWVKDSEKITTPEDLQRAISRLTAAIQGHEKIVVNGDPDADGITGTAILVAGLRQLGGEVSYDFPTRSKEGHGLQARIVDEAANAGVKVIITSDCGSKDVEAVDYASSLGIDVIICDHHILGKTLPNAFAIINPYRIEERTWSKMLSGAGVAFKFMVALYEALDVPLSPQLYEFFVVIAALGTLSDRMSLLSPMNRIIVKKGISILNNTPLLGLRALRDVSSGPFQELKARDVSRTIAPRLNAPGRIGDRELGIPDSRIVVDLLLVDFELDKQKAEEAIAEFKKVLTLEQEMRSQVGEKAHYVDEINEKRKRITSKIEDEIENCIKEQVNLKSDRIVVVKGKEWNSGVIGIDVDRLRERFLRPAMILTEHTGSDFLRASVRSIPSINIYQIIDAVGESFESEFGEKLYQAPVETASGLRMVHAFGGHSQACGFVIHRKNFDEFKQRLHEELTKIPAEQFRYIYEVIAELPLTEVDENLIRILDRLDPFGQAFEYPVFLTQSVYFNPSVRPFGNKYQKARTPHVDFVVQSEPLSRARGKWGGRRFNAVGFGLWEKFRRLVDENPNTAYDIIYSVELVRKPGTERRSKGSSVARNRIRLNVMDIRRHTR